MRMGGRFGLVQGLLGAIIDDSSTRCDKNKRERLVLIDGQKGMPIVVRVEFETKL